MGDTVALAAGQGGDNPEWLQDKPKELYNSRGWPQETGVGPSTIQLWETRDGKPNLPARRGLKRLFQREGLDSEQDWEISEFGSNGAMVNATGCLFLSRVLLAAKA